ncbi:MAG: peptide/nickel transport system ATP-binding protein [Campylobacterota bacterium]|nr:peptide/nickel transport system ATP-binding protein [Campylobacterota bacterium]
MIKVNKLTIAHNNKKLLDVSFEIKNSLAMVGMSGSGKSLTLKAILGMLPSSMELEIDIKSDFELKRGESVVLIPQNPFTSLNPMSKIHKQFFVPKERIKELLGLVDLDADTLEKFPSELSGGQLQRVVIAIALSHKPKLLLLDEPTTALDSATKNNIIALLKKLQKEMGFYLLFVSHDMASVENLCGEIVVLKNGSIIEFGGLENIIKNPKEEYTKSLIDSNFKYRTWRE